MDDRLPYGSGSVIYIKENKLKPYLARRYKGSNANGNPTYIRLGCYKTFKEARLALMENVDSSADDLLNEKLTMMELFDHFIDDNADHYSDKSKRAFRGLFKKFEGLHGNVYSNIKVKEMREIIQRATSTSQKRNLKYLFNCLDKEAEILNIPGRRQAQFLHKIRWDPKDGYKERIPFTDAEMSRLKANADDKDMHIPLILCYTGFRQGEFRTLLKDKVDLDKGTLTGGFKTEAGTNRVIPIHPFIRRSIEQMMGTPGSYLLSNEKGNKMSDMEFTMRYHMALAPYVDTYHVPHECRHTFRTRLDAMNVKDNIIRSLMGHAHYNEGDRSYFHPSLEQLREGIMQLWP